MRVFAESWPGSTSRCCARLAWRKRAQPVPARQGAPCSNTIAQRFGALHSAKAATEDDDAFGAHPWEGQATYQQRQVSYHRQAAGEVRSTLDIVHLKSLMVAGPKLAQAKLKVRAGTVPSKRRAGKKDTMKTSMLMKTVAGRNASI
jgi:hypothetical protein